MTAFVKPVNPYHVRPTLVPMTPYRVYVMQVQGVLDNIRFQAKGMDYLPAQLGGLIGQRQVLNEKVVLQNTEFKVE